MLPTQHLKILSSYFHQNTKIIILDSKLFVKKMIQNSIFIQKRIAYIDINNYKAKVPIQDNSIYMKVLKLPDNIKSKQIDLNQSKISNDKSNSNLQKKQPQPTIQNEQKPVINNKIQEKTQIPSKNLMDFNNGQNTQQQQQVQKQVVYQEKIIQKPKDLLEDGQKVELNEQEKEKVRQISEKAGQDLREKWNAEEKQNIDKHQIGLELEPIVLKWAKKGNQRNDIRTLLCTLHEILWENSGFTKVSLSQLLEEKNKNYLLAIRVVHPDKLQNGSLKNKYIAERVFFELKESWTQFQSK